MIVCSAILFSRNFMYDYQRVIGVSMMETTEENDIIIINKMIKNYDKKDIIVLKDSKNNLVVKRIIALPGESISCEEGDIYINDKKIVEDYIVGETQSFKKIKLKSNEYFVMGDNRENSIDSREYGPIQKEEIIGKVIKIIEKKDSKI